MTVPLDLFDHGDYRSFLGAPPSNEMSRGSIKHLFHVKVRWDAMRDVLELLGAEGGHQRHLK